MFPDKPIDEGDGLQTWFATAHRADKDELLRQIAFISNNEIMNGMLTTISGLMAVLNENRQILAVNDGFFRMLGIEDPAVILGLRPGEALYCAHAADSSAGCGTAKFCATCGAAIAIATTLATNLPVERKCALTASRNGRTVDFCLLVKAITINLSGERFILVFLLDITAHELRSSMERTFFNDIEQSLQGLGNTVELMSSQGRTDSLYLLDRLRRNSAHLIREVKIQNAMISSCFDEIEISPGRIKVVQLVREMNDLFFSHPAARGKILRIEAADQESVFVSDFSLLVRVISNMVLNAYEATATGGEIILRIEEAGDNLVFRVWNLAVIPEDTAMRVFQHYFSTKEEPGRGVGTYSMKVFGEKFLGGRVSFTSAEGEGTWFECCLPKGNA